MGTTRRWAGYLDIPEGKLGDWSIIHKKYKAEHEFSTATFRTAIIGGQRKRPVRYNVPTRFHALCEGEGIWMTDWPVEQAQCDSNLKPIRGGRILVGGLGLGLCATILARRKDVEHVTVVEDSQEVVKLVAEHLRVPRGKLTVVVADLFEYLDTRHERCQFDWAFHDIWQSDSLGTLLDTVLPLRHKSVANRFVPSDSRCICWNEDVMRGQILMGLQHRIQFTDAPSVMAKGLAEPTVEEMAQHRGSIWWDMYCPFWAWHRDKGPKKELAMQAASLYSVVFGQQQWEQRWQRWVNSIL